MFAKSVSICFFYQDEETSVSLANQSIKKEKDNRCGTKNVLSKDASEAVSQSSNLQQSVANAVSDTDRLEQFARML